MKLNKNNMKITIVGAGKVGSTAAFLCYIKELGEVVLWNRTQRTAKGIALDIMESGPLFGTDSKIIGTSDYKKTKDSDIVVITAGAPRKEGMNRDDLLNSNGKIIKDITKKIVRYSKNCILIVVTNPLDAMVYVAKEVSGFNKNKVIGMAGVLDTSRFKSFLAKDLKVSVKDVNAVVLGGHGNSMVPVVSKCSVNGKPLNELMKSKKIREIVKKTRNAGADIIKLEESSAFISPGASIVEMVEAIVKDKRRVLPCAAYLNGEYGVRGIFMGVPVVLGSNGIEKIVELRLEKKEKKEFIKSANHIKELIESLKI